MPTYGELFMKDYAKVYESAGVDVALEITNLDYLKLLMEQDMKDGVKLLREARRLQRKKQYSDAIKKYEAAIKKLNKCNQWVDKNVNNEDTLSWVIRLVCTPAIIALCQIARGTDLKHLTKSGCQNLIDRYIRSCQNNIADCKAAIKEKK